MKSIRTKSVVTSVGPMTIDVNDIGVSMWLNMYGEWAHEETNLIINYPFKQKRRMVDVGACLGWHTRVEQVIGFERFEAFEPNPYVFELLKRNAGFATCHECALFDKEGVIEMRVRSAETYNVGQASIRYTFDDGLQEMLPCDVKMLDSFGFDDVDFLKIDAEGSDWWVLEGAKETVARCRPLILTEANHNQANLREWLESRDYLVTEHPGMWYRDNNFTGCRIQTVEPMSDAFFFCVPKEDCDDAKTAA